MSPSYNPKTKTMHFSSQGWPGIGGFDVFKTTGELRDWSNPENVGYPINTSVDELYFVKEQGGDAEVLWRQGRQGHWEDVQETGRGRLRRSHLGGVRRGLEGAPGMGADRVHRQADVLGVGGDLGEHETQRVGAVGMDDVAGVDPVAQ